MWPVSGQPAVLRAIGAYLPVTKPTQAATAIGSKGLMLSLVVMLCLLFITCVGLGLDDEPVYLGFIFAIGWLIVFFLATVAFFKTE